jgi:hypothetical protein
MVRMSKDELRKLRGISYVFLPNQPADKYTEYATIQKYKVRCLHCENVYFYGTIADHIVVCPCNEQTPRFDESGIVQCECGGKYDKRNGISTMNHLKNMRHIEHIASHVKVSE